MALTLTQLIAAATDMNKIMGLNPPIPTEFNPTARGAAKMAQENKFIAGIKGEIIAVAEFKDESGNYDLQPGDIAIFQTETREVIKELSPATVERMKEVFASPAEAPEKKKRVGGGGFKPSPEAAERKEFMTKLISEGKYTKKEIIAKTKTKYPACTESALATMLSDGKNEKYNRFPSLIKENKESKILSF